MAAAMLSDPPIRIPLSVPVLDGNEAAYLRDCVETGWVSTAGPFVNGFEAAFAKRLGVEKAVPVQSGTAALHLALLVAGVKPGDLVLTSTLTFVATANAIRYCGAEPVFVDSFEADWQFDVALAEAFLADDCRHSDGYLREKASGKRIAALLPVHLMGGMVDMTALLALAERYGLPVIEDATEALGATFDGHPAGTLGDFGCFSFNGNKLVTAGGGGMVIGRDDAQVERCRHLSTQAKLDPIEGTFEEMGFNYRLTNLQAAVGLAQLERLEAKLSRRREIFAVYADAFADRPGLQMMPSGQAVKAACWLSTLRLWPDQCGFTSRQAMAALRAEGIDSRPFWEPLHLSASQQGGDGRPPRVLGGEMAASLQRDCLCLPSSPDLTADDQQIVVSTILAL
ncbi:MAG: aminotransferase class I/II-fold pyridoxal phosphate-dependent enzyme [Magnetovibrionaceae bacterium]